jgi:hypothetical protein
MACFNFEFCFYLFIGILGAGFVSAELEASIVSVVSPKIMREHIHFQGLDFRGRQIPNPNHLHRLHKQQHWL